MRPIVWLAGLSIIILLSCGALGFASSAHKLMRARELEESERRWARRPFSAYSIEIEDHHCTQIVSIRNEKVESVTDWMRCEGNARTITDLFALIRRDGEPGARCITQGCACDDRINVRASYDPELGYPREVYIRIAPVPNWRHLDYWTYLARHLRPPTCEYMAGDKLIAVHALIPVPDWPDDER